ncbi:MAG: LacI family transcriptional regulator, partial [Spirochaetaceae bacterium]|nr:LacI family transcriptional regulator [Spirochaetaceae bacterium]
MKSSMKPKTTQDDVARRAGVTRSMVSYVLNGSNRAVAPVTRQKILNAISELKYRPNKFAQALSMGNKGVLANQHIGIVLCNAEMFLRPYYTEVLAGIHQTAHEKGFHIRFIRFFEELKDPVLFNQLIHSEEICGLLLVAIDQCMKVPEDRRLIERIQEQIDQIVCVEWQMPGLSSVSFDRQAAAFQAVSYLFDQGYRDIAYIGESDQRVAGFKQAFLEHRAEDISGLYIDAAADMASGHYAVQRLHQSRGNLPGALCAGSDEVAVGILLYLHEQGIAVPGETAVISIDNIEMAEYTNPQLTTM